MKKGIAILLACILAFSMTACSGKPADEGDNSPAPPASTADKADTPEGGETSAEEQALRDAFNAMADSYNAAMEKLNTDANVKDLAEVKTVANQVAEVMNQAGGKIDAQELTADDVKDLTGLVESASVFVKELEAMLANYGGKTVVTISAKLTNSTGVEIHGLAMSPSGEETFGGNLISAPIAADATVEAAMNITQDSLVWDLVAVDAEGSALQFLGLDFSGVDATAGAQITLSVTEGGEYVAMVQ